jgi:hypothetical protein
MKPFKQIINNESGSVLILAILMLFAVTMLGFFSTTTSTIETKISANNALYKKAFYAAESGLEHARLVLTNNFAGDPSNVNRLAADPPQAPTWTFALKKNTFNDDTDDAKDTDLDGPDFDEGAVWFNNVSLGDCEYEVRVYDDIDDGMPGDTGYDPAEDTNSRVYVRSQGECYPNNSVAHTMASIEMILAGSVQEQAVTDYNAQSGAGAGKVSEGGDRDAIGESVLDPGNNKSPVVASNLGT